MKNILLKYFFIISYFLFSLQSSFAQCSMCRATIENKAGNGEGISTTLNIGILYLSAVPYLAFVIIALLWYWQAKKNHAKSNKVQGYSS